MRSATRRQDYRPPAWCIDQASLTLRLDPMATEVTSTLSLRPAQADPGPLRLDGEGLTLLEARLDGVRLAPGPEMLVTPEALILPQAPARPLTLETRVRIQPEGNTALQGLYRSGGIFCTQCEAEAFRRITWFLDRPDVLCRFRTRIEADRAEAPVLLGNGNRIQAGRLPGGRHYVVYDDPWPKPCYLFAIIAGPLAAREHWYRTAEGRDVRIRVHAPPAEWARTGFALEALLASFDWDARRYRRHYDLSEFNLVAIPDFNMGAMENKGLNIFNARYVLADPQTATDADYDNIASVVAHEYLHNYSGNRVTCRDWFQLSLKEGFTVFRDQEFTADWIGAGAARVETVRRLLSTQFLEDASPLAHAVRPDQYVDIDNFYTATVYEKGAELIRMLQSLVGEAAFLAGCDLFFARHDGQAVTIEDFVQAHAEVSGQDLQPFLTWYDQAGTPEVRLERQAAGPDVLTLIFRQQTPPTPGQPEKQPLIVPIRLGLLEPETGLPLQARLPDEAQAEPAAEHLLVMIGAELQVTLSGPKIGRAVPALGRGFSAPVAWRADLAPAEHLLLLAHDPDPVIRWQSAQHLYAETILQEAWDRLPSLADALGRALQAGDLDPGLRAALALPPSIGVLAQRQKPAQFDRLHQARLHLRRSLGRQLTELLLPLHRECQDKAGDAIGPETSAWRKLAHTALDLLVAAGTAAEPLAALAGAQGMTNRLARLAGLIESDPDAAAVALAGFRERFQADALAMDHYVSVQTGSEQADALGTAMRICTGPDFSLTYPNRVRAVIAPLAARNPQALHRPDGAGYRWLTELIAKLDPINPTLAAGLVTPLRVLPLLPAATYAVARSCLEALLARPALSVPVAERLRRVLDHGA